MKKVATSLIRNIKNFYTRILKIITQLKAQTMFPVLRVNVKCCGWVTVLSKTSHFLTSLYLSVRHHKVRTVVRSLGDNTGRELSTVPDT